MGKSPIVARINVLLAEKGIPKKKFYEDCQITSSSYSLWNTGKTKPKESNLGVIANYLGVSYEYLCEGVGPKEKKEKPALENEDELSEIKKAALEWILSKDDETIKRFIDGAKTMMGE